MSDLEFVAIDLKPNAIKNIPAKFTGASSGFSFFNSTGVPIYVTSRNGVIIKVDPCYDTSNIGKFTIRQNITYSKSDNIRLPSENIDDDILTLFYDIYNISDCNLNNKRSMHYDSVINLKTIKDYGDTIYLRNLDLSITLTDGIYDSFHPYTQKVSMERVLNSIKKKSNINAEITYRLVDNEKFLSTMYTKVGEIVMAVMPVQDYSLESGLYTIYNKFFNHLTGNVESKIVQDRIEHHGLNSKKRLEPIFFNTYEEALHYDGNSDIDRMKYEKKLAELRNTEIELKNLTLEMERQRRMEDEKIEDLKRQQQRDALDEKIKFSEMEMNLKREQQKLTEMEMNHKVEMMRLKEDYETKSNQRKNVSDIIKMAPVLIGGVIGVVGCIYGKNRS